MPSGYTEKIYKGEDVTFEQFVMGCARAFGALILMRDASADAEIPEFEPDQHDRERLEAAKTRLRELEGCEAAAGR